MTTNLARLPRVLSSENLMKFMYLVTQNYPFITCTPVLAITLRPFISNHGLVYELKPYTTNLTQPPLVTEAEIRPTRRFGPNWKTAPAIAARAGQAGCR
jgi:hypothetical protein